MKTKYEVLPKRVNGFIHVVDKGTRKRVKRFKTVQRCAAWLYNNNVQQEGDNNAIEE